MSGWTARRVWLRTGLTDGETAVLLDLAAPLQAQDLNPATESLILKLAHLPRELLHDGKAFLAECGIQPFARCNRDPNIPRRPTGPSGLFMATSPEDVHPVLNYEREEAAILEATHQQPIDLVVEESFIVPTAWFAAIRRSNFATASLKRRQHWPAKRPRCASIRAIERIRGSGQCRDPRNGGVRI